MKDHYRHEYKYLISRGSAELLKRRLPRYMQPDPHVGPTGMYTIRSLYFDDPHFTAFYDKVSGVDNRTKYRIRCYNYGSTFRLEKKEKQGQLTRKTGQAIQLADVLSLQADPRARCPETKEGLIESLRLCCASQGVQPTVLVDYDRTPFVCAAGNTRITLDENLRTLPHCQDLFGPHSAMIPVMSPEEVILEVKFDDFLPGHLSQVLSDIPKVPMAISKFAMCLNIL